MIEYVPLNLDNCDGDEEPAIRKLTPFPQEDLQIGAVTSLVDLYREENQQNLIGFLAQYRQRQGDIFMPVQVEAGYLGTVKQKDSETEGGYSKSELRWRGADAEAEPVQLAVLAVVDKPDNVTVEMIEKTDVPATAADVQNIVLASLGAVPAPQWDDAPDVILPRLLVLKDIGPRVSWVWMKYAREAGVVPPDATEDNYRLIQDEAFRAWQQEQMDKARQFREDIIPREYDIETLREKNLRELPDRMPKS